MKNSCRCSSEFFLKSRSYISKKNSKHTLCKYVEPEVVFIDLLSEVSTVYGIVARSSVALGGESALGGGAAKAVSL